MYIGQIISFYRSSNNGSLSYLDDNNQEQTIRFFDQRTYHLIDRRAISKSRGWKIGDVVKFEIEMDDWGRPRASFREFVGNPKVDALRVQLGDNTAIEGYFHIHDHKCKLREKTSGIEFKISNIKGGVGCIYPKEDTLMQGHVVNWDKLHCEVEGLERDVDLDNAIESLQSQWFIRAVIKEITDDKLIVSIDGLSKDGYVRNWDHTMDYQVGDPVNVQFTSTKNLWFKIL